MIRIACPDCGTEYNVPDGILKTGTRELRCGSCGRTWLAKPPEVGGREDRAHQLARIRQIVDDVHRKASGGDSGTPTTPAIDAAPATPVRAPTPGLDADPPVSRSNAFSALLEEQDDQTREDKRAAGSERSRGEPLIGDRVSPPVGNRIGDRIGARLGRPARDHIEDGWNEHDNLDDQTGRRSGGGFSTVLMLALILAAALTSLYAFAPQIGARFPEAQPILSNYRASVEDVGDLIRIGVEFLWNKVDSFFAQDGANTIGGN